MKKVLFILAVALVICTASCTENIRARKMGGKMTVNLPKGKKLINATWKDTNLWYLVEDMEDGYVPKTKHMYEESPHGLIEGEVVFIEKR